MASFADLGVDDTVSFVMCYRYIEVRVMFDHVTCVYVWLINDEKLVGSSWSFSWMGQRVRHTIGFLVVTSIDITLGNFEPFGSSAGGGIDLCTAIFRHL